MPSQSLPYHQYVYVDKKFTRNTIGFEPVVWFAVHAHPGRMWGCHVLTEEGAVIRSIPPHAIAFSENPEENWKEKDAQLYDVYGREFSLTIYTYLYGLDCRIRTNGRELDGKYLFTAIPYNDGFSEEPEQSKEYMFVKLYNGRLSIQPTNRIVFVEKSFTNKEISFPKDVRRQTQTYSCE